MDPYSPGWRAAGVALRTAHLFTMAVLVGGVWLAAPGAALVPWRAAAVFTGLGLLASEVSHGPRTWPWELRGLAVMAHVAALALFAVRAGRTATLLAVVIGAVGSHAPKRIRSWSVRGGAKKEEARE